NKCVGEGPSFGVLISDWGWVIIIMTAAVIAGVVVVLRKRKRMKPFTMQSGQVKPPSPPKKQI
ncbi:MAG: hypothetical protein QW286_01690, partial [Candidatus Aenigmatarchaeota archaeon]